MVKKTEAIMVLCQLGQIQHHIHTNTDVVMLQDIRLDMKPHNKIPKWEFMKKMMMKRTMKNIEVCLIQYV